MWCASAPAASAAGRQRRGASPGTGRGGPQRSREPRCGRRMVGSRRPTWSGIPGLRAEGRTARNDGVGECPTVRGSRGKIAKATRQTGAAYAKPVDPSTAHGPRRARRGKKHEPAPFPPAGSFPRKRGKRRTAGAAWPRRRGASPAGGEAAVRHRRECSFSGNRGRRTRVRRAAGRSRTGGRRSGGSRRRGLPACRRRRARSIPAARGAGARRGAARRRR